jgi:adenylylsulfate kinase
LAKALSQEFLLRSSTELTVLDGDAVRQNISKDLSFSKEDRHTNNLRVAEEALELVYKGNPVCVSLISPYRQTRRAIREKLPNFVEVYIKCPVEVCEERDIKGMYKLAREGKIKNFTGVQDPYEEPLNPDLVVETDKHGLKECVDIIVNQLEKLSYIKRHSKV